MATARDAAPERAQYWVVPVVRGLLAAVAAVVITFSQNHSPEFGLARVRRVGGRLGPHRRGTVAAARHRRGIRSLFAVNAVVTVVAGLLALTVPGGGLPFLLYLVSVWAAVTGFVELFAGLRARGRAPPRATGSPSARSPRSSRSSSCCFPPTPSPRSACSADTS